MSTKRLQSRMVVETSTGRIHKGTAGSRADQEAVIRDLHRMLSEGDSVTSLSVTDDEGRFTWVNIAHAVAMWVEDELVDVS